MGNNDLKNAGNALADMAKKIRELEAQNEALKAATKSTGKITLKVSAKGALSVYGMGRFPVTLYRSQWETLLSEAQVASIRGFITAHAGEFAVKGEVKASTSATSATGDKATAPAV